MADPLEAHECDGGWQWVKRQYAEHVAASMHVEGTTPPEAIVAGLLNSVYPCRICKPSEFFRWAKGHFAREHDIATCVECIAAHGGAKAAKRHATVGGMRRDNGRPPAPTDEDAPPDAYEPEPERRDLWHDD